MPSQVTTEDDVRAALAAPRFLLFKHSLVCPTSDRAFGEYAAFVDVHPDVPSAWIDVIGQRAWSRLVEAETGLRHESPQALWIVDGSVVWNASHFAITRTALERACGIASAPGTSAAPPSD